MVGRATTANVANWSVRIVPAWPLPNCEQLGQAIFEYIEAWYNPHRRHSRLGYESPVSYEKTGRAEAVPA